MKRQFEKYLHFQEENRQKRSAMRLVLGLGILILALKLLAYFYTGANAVLSDALESVINLAAGVFSLYSLRYAGKPRDSKHPFGYGKMESLGAAVQGALVFCLGVFMILRGLNTLIYPHAVTNPLRGLALVAISGVVNLFLARALNVRAKRLDSIILRADAKRLFSDAFSSAVVVTGLLLIYLTKVVAFDSLLAIGGGAFILFMGSRTIRSAVRGLLDREDVEVMGKIVDVLQMNSKPGWIDFTSLRASHQGMYLYVNCTMTLPWYWDLNASAATINEVETLVNNHFKENVELLIHPKPCTPKHCPTCRLMTCAVRVAPYAGKDAFTLGKLALS